MKFCPKCGSALKDAVFDVKTGEWRITCEIHGEWLISKSEAREKETGLTEREMMRHVSDLRDKNQHDDEEAAKQANSRQPNEKDGEIGAGFNWLFGAGTGQLTLCASCYYYGRTRVGRICNFFGTYDPREFDCKSFKPNRGVTRPK